MAEAGIKIWIRDIVQGTYEPAESGYGGTISTPSGQKSSRVRILGTVVDKYVSDNGAFATATIDDSTETINIKAFKDQISLIQGLELGDIVDVLGDINEYQGEIYVLPRAMQKVDINWEMLRRIELNAPKAPAVSGQASGAAADKQVESLEKVLLAKLGEPDKAKGVKIEDIINELKDQDENIVLAAVRNLMMKGDVFEPKKGIIRLV